MQKDEPIQPTVTIDDQAPLCETEMEYLRTACDFLSLGNKEINIKNICDSNIDKLQGEMNERKITENSAKPVIVNLNQLESSQSSVDQ